MLLQVSVDLSLEFFQRRFFVQGSQRSLSFGTSWADFTSLRVVRLQSVESLVQELVLLEGEFLGLFSFGCAGLELALRSILEDVYMMLSAFLAWITEAKAETQDVLVLVQFRFFPFTGCVLRV